jgi:hypothetical protein
MQTIDLDELWPRLTPTPGSKTCDALAAALFRATLDDRQGVQDTQTTDLELDLAAQTGVTIGDLAALRMPEVAFGTARPASSWSGRMRGSLGASRIFDTSAAVWLSLGFITGMIALHSVGFWSFVTAAVLHPSERDYQVATGGLPVRADQPFARPGAPPLTTGSLPDKAGVATAACVALAVDRASARTLAEPCSWESVQLRDAGRGKRADRLTDLRHRLHEPQAWTAEAERVPHSPATAATPATGTTAPQDFDLTRPTD